MMSKAASFPSVRNQGLSNLGKSQTPEGDLHQLRDSSGQFIRRLIQCFAWPAAMQNLLTTQPNTLFPTYDEVVNLTGLL
jgi:hypothetical protein